MIDMKTHLHQWIDEFCRKIAEKWILALIYKDLNNRSPCHKQILEKLH